MIGSSEKGSWFIYVIWIYLLVSSVISISDDIPAVQQ